MVPFLARRPFEARTRARFLQRQDRAARRTPSPPPPPPAPTAPEHYPHPATGHLPGTPSIRW